MNLRKKQIATLLCTTTLLLVGFQNCSPTNMKFSQAAGVDELGSVAEPGGEVGINNPSEEEPGGENPPSSEPPVVTNPPVESPEEAAYNRFTSIDEGAYLLSCGQTIKSITSISAGAKVIMVNANLLSLTSLDKDAELILVNSELKRVTSVRGELIKVEDAAEKQKWIDLCAAEDKYEAIVPPARSFSANTISAGNSAMVPRTASSYQITVISSGTALESLNAHGVFGVTSMQEGVSLRVKSANFRMTQLSKRAHLVLHKK